MSGSIRFAQSSRFPQSSRFMLLLALLLGLAAPGFVLHPTAAFAAPTAKQLERDFMAPCCRHSLLADHFSPDALAMKDSIAAYVEQGLTADSIRAIYVAQYGEEILSEPMPTGFNRISDIAPWVALALGAGVVLLAIRAQRSRGRLGGRARVPEPPRREDDEIERVIREDFDSDS